MQSQTQEILQHIEAFGSITPLEALSEYGCMRLASRISDLKKAGYPIKSRLVSGTSTGGHTVHYAEYYIEEEDQKC